MIASDTTRRAIPTFHAIGVTALFIGPFFSATDESGASTTAQFSNYYEWLGLFGDEWFLYVAVSGIVIAVVAALLSNFIVNSVRVPVIVLGSLAGLTLPIMFFVRYGNGVSVNTYVETWGWGLSAYAGACVSAALVAVVLGYLERRSAEN